MKFLYLIVFVVIYVSGQKGNTYKDDDYDYYDYYGYGYSESEDPMSKPDDNPGYYYNGYWYAYGESEDPAGNPTGSIKDSNGNPGDNLEDSSNECEKSPAYYACENEVSVFCSPNTDTHFCMKRCIFNNIKSFNRHCLESIDEQWEKN